MRVVMNPATTYRVGCQDGEAHFTYFLADDQLSFVWDGHFACPIELERGGYGEVLIATVALDDADLPNATAAHEWAQWFASLCQSIATQLEEGK
jgi:hypothetical protein